MSYKDLAYRCWAAMRDRCLNPKNPRYKDYGARGIEIHYEWVDSFESFLAGVGRRPSIRHTLERIDNNLGYVPGNVRWATKAEQNRNKRNTHYVVLNGATTSLAQLADDVGMNYSTLKNRLRSGLTPEQAISLPIRNVVGRKDVTCGECGVEFSRPVHKLKSVNYCNNTCAAIGRRRCRIEDKS